MFTIEIEDGRETPKKPSCYKYRKIYCIFFKLVMSFTYSGNETRILRTKTILNRNQRKDFTNDNCGTPSAGSVKSIG